MDQDDPDKRIVDLEYGLAGRKRGADLPAASPHHAAASRRFVASAAPPTTQEMMNYTYVMVAACMAVLAVVSVVAVTVLRSETVLKVGGSALFFAILVLGMPGYVALHRRMNREKKILICVTSDGLTVDTRPSWEDPDRLAISQAIQVLEHAGLLIRFLRAT